MVEKVSTGQWQPRNPDVLVQQALNPASNTNQARLFDTSLEGIPFVASLNRTNTNGIARYIALVMLVSRETCLS